MKQQIATLTVLTTLAVLIVVTASGCRFRTAAHEKGKITLGVCMSTFSSPYSGALIREFARYAPQRGCDVIIVDSQLDIQKEASNIDHLIALNVDAILVNVVDSKGTRAALKKAAKAGRIVICFDTSVYAPETLGIRAFTGAAHYQQAAAAAEVIHLDLLDLRGPEALAPSPRAGEKESHEVNPSSRQIAIEVWNFAHVVDRGTHRRDRWHRPHRAGGFTDRYSQ